MTDVARSTGRIVRRSPIAIAVLLGIAVFAAPAASADEVDDAISALQSSALYVAPDAQGKVDDASTVTAALGSSVKVAVLPSSLDLADAGPRLQNALSGPVTLAIFSGTTYQAKSNKYCSPLVNDELKQAVSAHRTQLNQNGDLTATIEQFAEDLHSVPLARSSACAAAGTRPPTGGSGTSSSGTASSPSSGSSAWPWVLGIGIVGAGGVGAFTLGRRRRRARELSAARARVEPYYDRLAGEVNSLDPQAPGLDPKDVAVARQALADAAERFTSAGSQLADANSVEQVNAARRTVLEGLYAARTARGALGLDVGPDLPPVDEGRGDQLAEPQQVTVQGQTFQGYPTYMPGAPYYYGGGAGVPGGWYGSPFWETLLVGSLLTGGLGGGWGGGGWGGGYGNGYGNGYETGYDAGRDGANPGADGSNGAGWGGGNSGDWSTGGSWGGGDSGSGWGGGDSGGGGDWGGGDGGSGGDGGGGGW